MTSFTMIAKTLHNLEDVLAEEIRELGGSDISIGRRAVSFTGDKTLLYKANLRLRTALRILKPILTFKATNPDELYEALSRFPWDTVMTSRQTFAIDTVVYSDTFTHSRYVSYRTKDAIVDFWRERTGERPSVRIDNPDIYFGVHIAHDEVTLSLDSSGESLHKRGYRQVQTDAPINEVLAAGILLKSGWRGETDLLDPMCGSGTFLIEAALIARNIAPGIYRQSFAFERWLDYDQALFEEIYNDDSAERSFDHHIYGSDILPRAIQIAEKNIARAGVSKHITLEVMSLQERPSPAAPALVVMNPPYGERLKMQSADELYGMIGERLKHNYPGCQAWIIAYRPEHFDAIGLRHNSRVELTNGALECELRSYELFAGKRDEYKRRPQEERKLQDSRKENHIQEKRPFEGRKPFARDKREGNRKPFDGKRVGKSSERREDTSFAHRDNDRPLARKRDDKSWERKKSDRSGEGRGEKSSFARQKGGKEGRPRREGANPWPNARFRYTDEDGTERRRPAPKGNFQVFRPKQDD